MDTPTEISIVDLAAERKRIAKEEEEKSERKKAMMEAIGKLADVEISSAHADQTPTSAGGLRRRGGGMTTARSEDSSSTDTDIAVESQSTDTAAGPTELPPIEAPPKKKKERNPDPLLWFGVFVPGSLRNAQTTFQKGLQDAVELTIIRQKLLHLEQEFARLQNQE
ncbi:hypothetical protein BG004_000596 [Podila humilis]|nr:hypothetical protein BG004_000596 [Podila humilis]